MHIRFHLGGILSVERWMSQLTFNHRRDIYALPRLHFHSRFRCRKISWYTFWIYREISVVASGRSGGIFIDGADSPVINSKIIFRPETKTVNGRNIGAELSQCVLTFPELFSLAEMESTLKSDCILCILTEELIKEIRDRNSISKEKFQGNNYEDQKQMLNYERFIFLSPWAATAEGRQKQNIFYWESRGFSSVSSFHETKRRAHVIKTGLW